MSSSTLVLRYRVLGWVVAAWMLATPSVALASFTTLQVASGLNRPVYAAAPVSDERLFIVEQGGLIRILSGGAVLATPFLDVSTELVGTISGNDERGLLGLAFPPDYATSGLFYINYTVITTGAARQTKIVRYRVSANPDVADASTAEILLAISQPFSNHNGGNIAFGGDGMLYIGMGDGGSAGDPQDNAQSDSTLLGKMLRIDVSGGLNSGYSVPPNNPFVGAGDPLDEIWAKGLRNPYRWSFDRLDGNLYIADVGQNLLEEIDVAAASDPGGLNYGWRIMEASDCFDPEPCVTTGLTLPVHEYTHGGSPFRCSVTGGFVYRGSALELWGHYFFADFCSAQIWSFKWDGASGTTDFQERTGELVPDVGSIGTIASFAEGGTGELFIVDRGSSANSGEIYKIESTSPVPALSESGLAVCALLILGSALAAIRTHSGARRSPDSLRV